MEDNDNNGQPEVPNRQLVLQLEQLKAEMERRDKEDAEAKAKAAEKKKPKANKATKDSKAKRPKPAAKKKPDEDDEPDEDAGAAVVVPAKPLTDMQKHKAAQANPPGVRIANSNLENSLAILAGYTMFRDTDELKHFLTNDAGIQAWIAARERNFGIEGVTQNTQWKYSKICKLLGSARRDLLYATLPLDPNKTYYGVVNSNQSFGTAAWVVAISKLIYENNAHFPDTTTSTGPKVNSYAAEDCNRAYNLLRAAWRMKTREVDDNSKKRQRNELAVRPYYLTDADYRRFQLRKGDLLTAVDKDTLEPSMASKYEDIQRRMSTFADGMRKEGHSWEALGDPQENRRRRQAIREEAGESNQVEAEQFMEEHEDSIWASQIRRLGTSDMSKLGKEFARPMMPASQVQTFLVNEFQKLDGQIIYEQPEICQDPIIEKYIDRRELALSHADGDEQDEQDEAGQVEPGSTKETTANVEAFWQLQGQTSHVSAQAPAYWEACTQLKLDPEGPIIGALELKPWQVMGAAWMQSNEDSHVGGGIIADDCGLGKTALALSHIYLSWKEQVRLSEQPGSTVEFRPTLILCPATVVNVWHSEWDAHFSSKLDYLQYYGHKQQYDATREPYILPSNTRDLIEMLTKDYPPNKPRSGKLIIVTSYTTWYRRTLRQISREEYMRRKAEQTKQTEPATPSEKTDSDHGDSEDEEESKSLPTDLLIGEGEGVS